VDVEDLAGNALESEYISSFTTAPIPNPYYNSLNLSLTDNTFKQELHNMIDDHTSVAYTELWTVFNNTDTDILGCSGGDVGDVYSSYCWTYGTDQCGSFISEGDCYNREQLWPKSWANDTSGPEYSDIFNVYPTDGYMNTLRADLPYCDVDSTEYTSTNGSKKGICAAAGYSGSGFEPIDSLKGDFARTYFYLAVRYYTEDSSWASSIATNGADILIWQENMLRSWHAADQVSQKELDRNEAIYNEQGNRNPFIDNPSWVNKITDF
jgi:endonuclease I